MSRNQDHSEHEGDGHGWRNGAISVAVLGAIIGAVFYSGRSSVLRESRFEPSSPAVAPPAEVQDCIRVKRIEIVDEAGRVVGVWQGTGTAEDGWAMLELYGHGARAGRLVHIDPKLVLISAKQEGATEFSATSAEWTVKRPPGEDDVMVRIAAHPDGGSVYARTRD